MNQELKEILIGLFLFFLVVGLAWYFLGSHYEPDYQSRPDYQKGSAGYPLWE